MSTPTYEQVKERVGRRPAVWINFVASMKPGEVKEVSDSQVTLHNQMSGIRNAAVRLGLPIHARKFDGKVYAVYLKPEDVNGQK